VPAAFNLSPTSRLLAVGFIICGCGRNELQEVSSQTQASQITHIFAIDTSGSAASIKETVFKKAASAFYGVNPSSTVYLYRFDNFPAEVYAGQPPSTEEEGYNKINKVLSFTQGNEGTNLLALVEQIDKHFERGENKIVLTIYTDCGYEKMTNEQLDLCKEKTQLWKKQKDISVVFSGVADGHREKLRKLIGLNPDRLQFEE
jgi:hypothetical protein